METSQIVDKLARTSLSVILIFAVILTVYRVATYKYLKEKPLHLRSGNYKIIGGIGEIFDSLIYAAVFIFMVIRPFAFQTFQIPTGSLTPTCMVGDFIGLNKAIYRYTDPKRGDIVVFRPPVEACTPKQLDADGNVNTDFVKRLIGLPGDLIEMHMGEVYVNGKRLWEPYKHYTVPLNEEQTQFKVLDQGESDKVPKANWKLVKYNGNLIPLNYTETDANHFGSSAYSIAPKYRIEDPTEWAKAKSLPAEKIPAGYYLFMGDNRNGSFDGRGWGLIAREAIVGRAEFIWMPLPRIGKIHHVDNGDPKRPDDEVDEILK